MKRPKQTAPPQPPAPAPAGLSERSAALWAAVVRTREIRSPGRLSLLEQSLRALDRADQCRAAVDAEGLTATTAKTGARHVHPLLKSEVEFRRQFLVAWAALGLQVDPKRDGSQTFPTLDDICASM